MEYLFVYGTLKRDFENHFLIEGEFVCIVHTKQKMSLFEYKNLGFPYLTKEPQEHIQGELFKVKKEILNHYDKFEDVPNLYIREKIELDNGIFAWAYILNEVIKEKKKSLVIWEKNNENR